MGKFITFILIGIVLAVLGITNIRGNVSSVHWYNRHRVDEKNIPQYGKCIGTGTLIIGGSLILSAILEAVFRTTIFDYMVVVGFVIGLIFMLYGQFKYNKGIF